MILLVIGLAYAADDFIPDVFVRIKLIHSVADFIGGAGIAPEYKGVF